MNVIDITNMEQFNAEAAARAGANPFFVDFHAAWCAPCKTLWKKLLPYAQMLHYDILRVEVSPDVPGTERIARKYRVRALPTLVLFWKGAAVGTMTGITDEPDCGVFKFTNDALDKAMTENRRRTKKKGKKFRPDVKKGVR